VRNGSRLSVFCSWWIWELGVSEKWFPVVGFLFLVCMGIVLEEFEFCMMSRPDIGMPGVVNRANWQINEIVLGCVTSFNGVEKEKFEAIRLQISANQSFVIFGQTFRALPSEISLQDFYFA
jgi:hypothetical protein